MIQCLQFHGKPYDTLDEVIGIRENESSLKAFGVKYKEIQLKENKFDREKIKEILEKGKIKLIHIQRSRGYSLRESLTIKQLEEEIKEIRKIDKDVIIFIDNCYCEFVEEKTPLEVGADIIVRITYKEPRWRNCSKSVHM
jgi:cystathionine beta-lyase family protein involved in aluminum resistance